MAHFIDPNILKIENMGYDRWQAVYFQRTTVILAELLLIYALNW